MSSLKRTGKVALCGVIAALATVVMLLSYFPYLTYAVPAVAGLLFVILAIEAGKKWAFASYLAACVLVFLMAEQEAKLMFIAFFGYYPILKGLIESLRKKALEYVLNFSTGSVRSETMLHFLASKGIYVSSGSACSKAKPSHVLAAMGLDSRRIDTAIRVSFSRENTEDDVRALLDALAEGMASLARK